MRGTRINRESAVVHKGLRGFHQSAGGINQIVDHQTGAAVYVSDDVHDFGDVHLQAALVDDRQRCIHLLCEEAGALHPARIG